ncbi:unnamed protein product [Penicillium salamii]|uniref:Serine hydrolase domain-containing protein n=1 Tax=Penicillium salamii TaxID=1612424 RepID=A0A9W4JBV6_9EURO|nr:unnamed protein product [Penicillium salamii]CAG8391341.1 unnamed protein product [Penicillium salamii]CAG8394492.1 unnamed protein product [Penicillium salamii]CAG8398069.1 unnamed protein product [Penicillium salamii]
MDLKQPQAPSPSCAKILMLHAKTERSHIGHAQSGHFFRCKTHFLQETVGDILLKSIPKDQNRVPFDGFEFHYPSGLWPANPDDFNVESNHMWVWGYGDPERDRIRGLETTIEYLLRFMDIHGPFIGIMGFSTGACIGAIIASLLEKRESVGNLRFDTNHPPLGFLASFCGFPLEHPVYKSLYNPKIETPTLHVMASMDVVIEERQSLRLMEFCKNSYSHYFFGTHYVPRSEDFLDVLANFFEHAFENDGVEEDEWEDLEN